MRNNNILAIDFTSNCFQFCQLSSQEKVTYNHELVSLSHR